jgi:hypothetical protein
MPKWFGTDQEGRKDTSIHNLGGKQIQELLGLGEHVSTLLHVYIYALRDSFCGLAYSLVGSIQLGYRGALYSRHDPDLLHLV